MEVTTAQSLNPAAVEGAVLHGFNISARQGIGIQVSSRSSGYVCRITVTSGKLYDSILDLPAMQRARKVYQYYECIEAHLPTYDDVLEVAVLLQQALNAPLGLALLDAQIVAKKDKPTSEQIQAFEKARAMSNSFLNRMQPLLPCLAEAKKPVDKLKNFRGQTLRTKKGHLQVRLDPHSAKFVHISHSGLSYQDYLVLRDHAVDFFGGLGIHPSV